MLGKGQAQEQQLRVNFALLFASLGWAQGIVGSIAHLNPQHFKREPGHVILGCLNGSDGNYTLTQYSTGTVFKLVGSADMIKEHVGHEWRARSA